MVGCGLISKKAEMPETTTAAMESTEMESDDMKTDGDMMEAAVEEVTLNVTGMTWGACTSKVQDALSKVTGVSEVVSVSSTDNTAVVKVEKGKVQAADLTSAVQGAGFSAEVAQ